MILNVAGDVHKMSFKLSSNPGFFLLVISLILFIIFTGCTTPQNATTSEENKVIRVSCTIPPQEEFIRAVGGDKVQITVMVPPGASPHTFEPNPSQIASLESADLYLALGSGIEFEERWLSKIREMYPNLIIVNLSENITLLPNTEHNHEEIIAGNADETGSEHEGEGATDPHVWLSLKNAAVIVNATCDGLSNIKPDKKDEFVHNRDIYLNSLSDLDKSVRKSLENIPSRIILVYHPAFGYFCRDYNLTQLSIEKNGHEPTGKTLGDIIKTAREENITFVFTEPEFSPKGAEILAKEINGTVVLISPLAGDYLKNMQYIAESMART